MEKINVKPGEWVVVCDGRKALLLENVGDTTHTNLHTREVREHPEPRTSAQGTDRPGKVHPSVGTAGSAVEQTDWHDLSERAFLTELAGQLHDAVTSGETRSLIMVAAPRALGMIREAYSPALRHAIRAEVGKDLVNIPVHEIEKQLFS